MGGTFFAVSLLFISIKGATILQIHGSVQNSILSHGLAEDGGGSLTKKNQSFIKSTITKKL